MQNQEFASNENETIEQRSNSQAVKVKTSRTVGESRNWACHIDAAQTTKPNLHQAAYTNLTIKGGRNKAQKITTVADEYDFDEDKARENLRLIDHILQKSGQTVAQPASRNTGLQQALSAKLEPLIARQAAVAGGSPRPVN